MDGTKTNGKFGRIDTSAAALKSNTGQGTC